MSSPDGDVLLSDQLYARAMERANSAFLDALRGIQVSDRESRWAGMNTTTWTQQPGTPRQSWAAYRAGEHIAERERIEGLRVNRDPCPLCAVRADIGCKHRRIA
jgi:hypothetical protein